MDSELLLPWIVGTIVCALGFLKWPRSPIELLKARFVFPLSIWIAIYAQVLVYLNDDAPYDRYARARDYFGPEALWYTTICLCGFWLGYILPVGGALARPLARLEQVVDVDRARLRPFGTAICLGTVALYFAAFGGHGLSLDYDWKILDLPDTLLPFVSTILRFTSIIGPLIVGFCWPEKHERALWTTPFYMLLVALSCVHFMATFSRGAGLPVLLAAAAFSIRRGRVGWQLPAAIVWSMICAHAGLEGRGEHGHFAGLYAFADFLYNETLGDLGNIVKVALNAVDAYTSLCIEIHADQVTDVRLLSPGDWLRSQIPLPRFLGFMPEWTPDYTLFVGGYQTWGYTVSFLGDTKGHLGDFGALVFVAWGILYRMVSDLAFQRAAWTENRLRPYVILLFITYGALALGVFQSNRPMVVIFFFPAYLIVGALIVQRLLTNRSRHSSATASVDSNTLKA